MDRTTSAYGEDRAASAGLVDRVRETAAAQLNAQKERATDGLGTVAQAVRQTTQNLREQRHERVAGYVEQAADQIERLSNGLKNKDVTDLLNDAQRLARRQPALFIGGAFALGLAGARFLKSSSPEDERESAMYAARGRSTSPASTAYGSGGRPATYTPVTADSSTTPGAPREPETF